MKISYKKVKALYPCYDDKKLKKLLPRPLVLTVSRLLSLPKCDARWLVSNLMDKPQRVKWANNCATRAKGYATATATADYAAATAVYTAAAYAATAAAAAAAYTAAYANYATAAADYAATAATAATAAATAAAAANATANATAAYAAANATAANAYAEHKLAMVDAVKILNSK